MSHGALHFDIWDAGRLYVNRQFLPVLQANGLTTFAALYDLAGGEVVRAVGNRRTTRVLLPTEGGQETFYLKRHGPARLRDRIKPLLHLSWPILGARNEWEAILRFHANEIPTMTPVAFGECRSCSLVMTRDLGTERTLLDWANGEGGRRRECTAAGAEHNREITQRVAAIARHMHEGGLHHQDFYLNHLLCCGDPTAFDIRVIDLGRVRQRRRLSQRWIIKDLAQLDYSARRLSCSQRLRFLRLYLDRPFCPADRRLVRQIALKSRHIAAHTAKNNL
jgi:heptose I phosphotransferase